MISSTVGALIDGELDDLDLRDYSLYLVRDDKTVFYVGKSRDPVDRLWQHLGLTIPVGVLWSETLMSSLGRLIKANLPEARSWQIELLTVKECEHLIHQYFPHYLRWDVDVAEEALVLHWRPCLNRIYNHNPARLPDRYRVSAPKIANEGVRLQ